MNHSPNPLRGKTAVITGGSRGIGFAIARELAARGCHLAICARHPARLRAAASELSADSEILALLAMCAGRSRFRASSPRSDGNSGK